jgi:hypothetical protein
MTEAEWLSDADFGRHYQFVEARLSPRRARLLAAAFCRATGPLLDHPDLRDALDVIERYAEGLAPVAELAKARQRCRDLAVREYEVSRRSVDRGAGDVPDALARHELAWGLAYAANEPVPVGAVAGRAVIAAQRPPQLPLLEVCRWLVREVAGNPFRPVAFAPAWRTSTVLSLASQMYDLRDFGAMPILADALQDAGCTSEDVLNHCRDATITHVRGCWVLDGVLGRA